MEKQGEKVQESLTPIGSSSIGPIKPTVPTQAKRLNRTGVILPVNLLEKNSPSTPTTPVVTTPPVVPEQISVSGSSGSQMQSLSSSPSTRKNSIPAVQPAAGSVIFNVTRPPVPPSGAAFPPPPGVLHRFPPPQPNSSSGWKDGGWKDPPKSGWNDSPPRKDWAGSSTIPIHVTPNVTLSRVPPPPVIRREYSPSYPLIEYEKIEAESVNLPESPRFQAEWDRPLYTLRYQKILNSATSNTERARILVIVRVQPWFPANGVFSSHRLSVHQDCKLAQLSSEAFVSEECTIVYCFRLLHLV